MWLARCSATVLGVPTTNPFQLNQKQRPAEWCKSLSCTLNPGYAGVEGAAQASGTPVGVARGGQASDPGLSPNSTRRTVPKIDSGASALASLLDGSTAGELIPELVRHGLQQLIELEVAAVLGAERHERSEEGLSYRNGYRPHLLTTQVGEIDLQIPKLRSGSVLPSILELRRRADQALCAVVMEAYVAGVSTCLPDRRPACRRH